MTLPVSLFAAMFSVSLFPLAMQAAPQTGDAAPIEAPLEDAELETEATDTSDKASEDTGVTGAPFVDDTVVLGAARETLLEEIAAALGSVETAQGRFFQASSDFREAEGAFYLRRPGRMRFEYDAPSPLLIVADGATVAIEDRDLETQDRVPLRATPLALLLDDEIDFEIEAEVLDVRRTEDLVSVTLRDKSGENDGTLSLLLDAQSLGLLQWRTVDPSGVVTSVQLAGIETGIRINPRLFRIEELDAEDERD